MVPQLNENQQEAVNWNAGPLMVLAGPGSGKTTVLTQRIIRIINESPEERFRILALTFTQNAASNMRSKIDQAISIGRERVYLTTFHSFCADVIRQHGALEGIKTEFNIMTTELDQESLLLEIIQECIDKGLDLKKEDIRYMLQIKSFLVNCIEPTAELKLDTEQDKARYLYSLYVSKMKNTGRLDYEGMLYFAWVLLGKKQVHKHYSIVYKYLCIDEYQDTNLSQYNIITRLLNNDNPNLFIVADDDQIIYQWNGASPERLKSIIDKYSMQVLQLPENYRCPSEVVNIANKMIAKNNNRFPAKNLGISTSEQSNKDVIVIKSFDCLEDEISWIIEDIRQKARSPNDTKILGRTHKLLNDTKKIFAENKINAVIHQRKSEFTSFPMRFLHSLLRLFSTRGDKVYLQRLLSSFYQIEGINVDYHDIIGQSSFTGGDFLKAWVEKSLVDDRISENSKIYISRIINEDFYINFEKLITISFDWLDSYEGDIDNTQDGFSNYMLEKEIFNSLNNDIKSINRSDLSLSVFLQELDLRDKSEPVPEDSFELITIHGAKGLEFKNVYLIGMVNDILPSYNSIKPNSKPELLEEERRSCYVAITRTQQTLSITYSSKYWNWPKEPSLFLREMGLIR